MTDDVERIDEARSTIQWLWTACRKREQERERCYQVVYQAMIREDDPQVLEVLKGIAFKIVDPD